MTPRISVLVTFSNECAVHGTIFQGYVVASTQLKNISQIGSFAVASEG